MILQRRGCGLAAFFVLLLVIGGECDNVGAAAQASSQKKLSVRDLVKNAEVLLQTGLKARTSDEFMSADDVYRANVMSVASVLLITGVLHFIVALINAGMRAKQDYSLPIEHFRVVGNLEEETRYYILIGWTVVLFVPVLVISVGALTNKLSDRYMVWGMLLTLLVWQVLYLMDQFIHLLAFYQGNDEPNEITASDDMRNDYDFVPPPQDWSVPGARSTTSIHPEPEPASRGSVVTGGHTLYFDDFKSVGDHVIVANRLGGSASVPNLPSATTYYNDDTALDTSRSDSDLVRPSGRATAIPHTGQGVQKRKKTYGQALRPSSTPF